MGRSTSMIAARWVLTVVMLLCVGVFHRAPAQESGQKGSSYMPVEVVFQKWR